MVTLYLLHPQQKTPLQQWQFEDEFTIRIGRASDNHVILTNPLVSRYHLELKRIDAADNSQLWQLMNQGTNGTFLNGVLVSQSLLTNGSLIQLARGGPTLRIQIEAKKAGEAGEENTSHPSPLIPHPSTPCTHSGNSPQNLFCIYCGQPLSVQQTIRQYKVLRVLGRGGMGTTYLAWNPFGEKSLGGSLTKARIPQLLALKEMNVDLAGVAKAQELFEREARTLKNLYHQGIPKYYDFFVEAGRKYLAMELIHGQNLEQLIYRKGPLTQDQAIAWMLQTCEVLDYLHRQDPPLIHRDIKPANLMLRTIDQRIIVLDFGAVKEIGTAFVTRIGAESYCAPEQERGQPVTQSDLYAVGTTLIFLLTGEAPFKFYQLRGRSYRFQLEGVPNITPQLQAIIEQVTEPSPSDRYATAKELAAALRACE